jgi:hypothetical protein
MSPEIARQILQKIEDHVNSRPSAIEFEMAYQARVAIDRIKFAIRHSEQFGQRSTHGREAGLQLLDALQRLESIDRRFQERSNTATASTGGDLNSARAVLNGLGSKAS